MERQSGCLQGQRGVTARKGMKKEEGQEGGRGAVGSNKTSEWVPLAGHTFQGVYHMVLRYREEGEGR
eukprot:23849-Chlamydomonas_euryale.AAC.1